MFRYLPIRIARIVQTTFDVVPDPGDREQLRAWADAIARVAWERWLSERPIEDNRPDHEFIVLDNAIKIGVDERLDIEHLKLVTAFALLHDTHIIPRVTETSVRRVVAEADAARERGALDEAAELDARVESLRRAKDEQRHVHMAGGVRNARLALSLIADSSSDPSLRLADSHVEKLLDIIGHHDLWKLKEPWPRLADGRVALVCLEADALYPLHPIGVAADLDRPDENGAFCDPHDPARWRSQLKSSLKTLHEYRANWQDLADEAFQDGESIFRTPKGYALYCAWREFWKI